MTIVIQWLSPVSSLHVPQNQTLRFSLSNRSKVSTDDSSSSSSSQTLSSTRRRVLSLSSICVAFSVLICSNNNTNTSWSKPIAISEFFEIGDSGGVKALELRSGTGREVPVDGDQVAIHYYGRLAAKQGWRFDSTYDHKDEVGDPIPFIFTLGSGKVISGIEVAVRSMKVGGIRRVIIPPSQGYQNTSQEPIPPNFFDRQRLFTTIFNPTRLANGEGSTLGTLIFDIELVSLRHGYIRESERSFMGDSELQSTRAHMESQLRALQTRIQGVFDTQFEIKMKQFKKDLEQSIQWNLKRVIAREIQLAMHQIQFSMASNEASTG